MKHFTSFKQRKGELGERIAQQFLLDKGFSIIECNYTKKFGEIDIVALKGNIIHFIEVKTLVFSSVPRETLKKSKSIIVQYNPLQNISRSKLRKFSKMCAMFLLERGVSHETKWMMDAIAVVVSHETRSAKVEVLWNICE